MKKSNKSLIIKLPLIALAVAAVFFYYKTSQESKLAYTPFAIRVDGSTLPVIASGAEMIGSKEDELFIADPKGSRIFAKAGLNYVVANTGPDEIYLSLCSSKIIDNKVMVVEGFDPTKDKLKVFCAHGIINIDQIKVIHDEFEGTPITYVEIAGKKAVTAIALLGDIDIRPEDIILNEPFVPANNVIKDQDDNIKDQKE